MITFFSENSRSVRAGIVTFGEVARLEHSLTENPGLERIQYLGQSPADVAQGLRKARESCFMADRTNAPNMALLITPGILGGDIRGRQNNAIEVSINQPTNQPCNIFQVISLSRGNPVLSSFHL